MNRMAYRRSRSRSRTPPVRAKPKTVVNMLDTTALAAAKEASLVRRKPISTRVTGPDVEGGGGAGERITCTIEGSGARKSVFNRVSGGRFEGGGRFDGNRSFEGGNRSFEGGNRSFGGAGGGRFGQADDRRGSFGDRRGGFAGDGTRRTFPERRSFGDRPVRDEEGASFRRNREDGEEKPVMKLVDPQEVPRSTRFFTHDDRDGREWHGRDMYDPRKDTGRYEHRGGGGGRFDRDRRDRDFGGSRDFGNRDFGNRRFDRGDRGDDRGERRFDRGDDRRSGGDRGGSGWDGFARQSVNGYTGSRFGEKSGSDGVWVHDKFMELEDEEEQHATTKTVAWIEGDDSKDGHEDQEEEEDDNVLVIDSGKTERTVE